MAIGTTAAAAAAASEMPFMLCGTSEEGLRAPVTDFCRNARDLSVVF